MRIVAGTARGRKLQIPTYSEIRPTKDRVREAIFNSLQSHGLIENHSYLDLFAGTGSLGLEALSRGARSVVFVDSSQLAIECVTENINTLDFENRAEIRYQDAMSYLKQQNKFDVAILDPPYKFDAWESLLSEICAGSIVIETSQTITLGDSWRVLKEQSYGQSNVLIATNRQQKGS